MIVKGKGYSNLKQRIILIVRKLSFPSSRPSIVQEKKRSICQVFLRPLALAKVPH